MSFQPKIPQVTYMSSSKGRDVVLVSPSGRLGIKRKSNFSRIFSARFRMPEETCRQDLLTPHSLASSKTTAGASRLLGLKYY